MTAEPESLLDRLRRYRVQLADQDSSIAIMAAANFVVDARDALPEIIEAFELLARGICPGGVEEVLAWERNVSALLSKVSGT